jgi:hypothetical protein
MPVLLVSVTICVHACAAVLCVVQVALDLESVDYEGTMATKLRLCRRIFDTVGHKSLQTQGFKVRGQPF